MNKNLILIIGLLIVPLILASYNREVYDYQGSWLKEKVNYSKFTARNLSGNLTWTDLYSFPVACPMYYAITENGDSNICSDYWVNIDGDSMTGPLLINKTNVAGLKILNNSYQLSFGINELGHGNTGGYIDYLQPSDPAYFYTYLQGKQSTLLYNLNGGFNWRLFNNETPGNYGQLTIGNTPNLGYIYFQSNHVASGTTLPMIFAIDSDEILRINSDGLKINGGLNQTGGNATINNIYGGMFYNNHTATELNFASDGVYYSLFMTNATHLNGFTANGIEFNGNSNLTCNIAGLYQASFMASGSGQNNYEYYTSLFVNLENREQCEHRKKLTSGGDIITQTGTCFVELDVGDEISVRTANIGNTGTGNYYSSNLNLVRIGD